VKRNNKVRKVSIGKGKKMKGSHWERREKGRVPLGTERKEKDLTGNGKKRKGSHWESKEKESIPLGKERKGKDPAGKGKKRKGFRWERTEKMRKRSVRQERREKQVCHW
jgi:hypothetical protein